MMEDTRLIMNMVRRGAQEATVCTEPAMIAFAVAKASSLTGEPPVRVEVTTSPGVMKNCLAVGLPCTDRKGPAVAAALGAVAGRPEMGLQALRGVTPESVLEAHRLLDDDGVEVACDSTHSDVYCTARVAGATRTAEVTIEGGHSRIVSVRVDGREVGDRTSLPGPSGEGEKVLRAGLPLEPVRRLSYDRLLEAVMSADAAEIQYLKEGAVSALRLAEESLRGGCAISPPGFQRALSNALGCVAPDDGGARNLVTRARLAVAAAVCARMAGVVWPVLTSCGSGNQGISVAIPVLMAARHVKAGPVEELRSLLLAHATNLYIKAFTGTISALCGAVSVGAGVAASVCWLMGGDRGQVEGAAQIVLGNLYGMICDGAKTSCANKCASGVAEGILAARMALNGAYPRGEAGIVGCSLRDTAMAMGSLSQVLNGVDPLIIEIRGGDSL
ncbi:MAG: L-serine ammonia-lyase, iron-sulfur-dependent, subunit alpha [Ignavibacteriales bacterium]